jgi:hypothetical protein
MKNPLYLLRNEWINLLPVLYFYFSFPYNLFTLDIRIPGTTYSILVRPSLGLYNLGDLPLSFNAWNLIVIHQFYHTFHLLLLP